MNYFQLIATIVTGSLMVLSLMRLFSPNHRKGVSLVSTLVWFLSCLFILRPDLAMSLANAVGIGRGADLVLYVFVIISMIAAFYFEAKHRNLEAQMTILVRHIAIANAKQGVAPSKTADPEDPA